jgi:hypothetical protein
VWTLARMAATAVVSALSCGVVAELAVSGSAASKAPEFPSQDPSRWLGTPVRLADLRGKVVLLDVWTFG